MSKSVSESPRTARITPRPWGLTVEQLAAHPTVFREDLLAGQGFVISGGGSGMGRATALLAARLGAEVTICGRDEAKLARAAEDIKRLVGKTVAFEAITIRDPEQVAGFAARAFARHDGIVSLVNSAGGQYPQAALDFSVKGWNAVVDTNLNGTWWMMQAFARLWRDRGEPGAIVNITAVVERGIPHSAHTAAARAGVAALTKSVAVEWAPLNIRVNCLAPGTIETEGLNNYPPERLTRSGKANPLKRMGDTWDIAEAVIYLSSPAAKFVTGEVHHVDGGMQLWGTNWPLGVPEHFRDA